MVFLLVYLVQPFLLQFFKSGLLQKYLLHPLYSFDDVCFQSQTSKVLVVEFQKCCKVGDSFSLCGQLHKNNEKCIFEVKNKQINLDTLFKGAYLL